MLRLRLPFLFALIMAVLGLVAPAALGAQSISWQPAGGSIAIGQQTELSLIFDDCSPKGIPALPGVTGLVVGTPSRGEQNSFKIENNQTARTRTVFFTFPVRATQKGILQIPTFTVETDRGVMRVPAVSFDVTEATVGQGAVSLESVANSRFTLPTQVWAGEVFPLTYTLNVARRYFYQLGNNPEWTAAPLTIEEWGKPELFEMLQSGEPRIAFNYKTRAYAKTPATITLNPATQLVNLQTGTSNFGLFARPSLDQFSITTKPTELVVRPLPKPAPAGFNGAVGSFQLTSKVVPAAATVGEPITWTIELVGTGNWPDIPGLPARSVSRDFRIVQPQAKRTNKENALFESTLAEDIVLIPTKPGSYTLPPLTFAYFDPTSGKYQTASTPPATLTIAPAAEEPAKPAAPGIQSAATPTGPAAGAGTLTTPTRPPATPPPPPAAIPRDPLPGSASGLAPVTVPVLLAALGAPLVAVGVLWLAFALGRARRTDPLLPQREARARLITTLAALRSANAPSESARLLRLWQRDTATLWRLPQAVPTAAAFAAPATAWAELWTQAERALYAANTSLPTDWLTRAEAALAAKTLPGFSVFSLFRPRNLVPLFVVATLTAAALAPTPARAATATPPPEPADALALYNKGKFADASKALATTVDRTPTDWVAHHNLALALAQQNRWGEAAAHAAAAFVQNPGNASVRWHLAFTFEKASFAPPPLAGFAQPGPVESVVRLASPVAWQWVLLASSVLLALGLAARLWLAYGRPAPWLRSAGWVLIGTALVLQPLGWIGYLGYGAAAQPSSVIVWRGAVLRSIPTEVDTTQKTTPVAPGSLATVEKSLLGWRKLAFANGQTGWVRVDDVVGLWAKP